MLKTLRAQLLLVLLGVSLMTLALSIVFFGISERKSQLNQLQKEIVETELLVLKNTENINNYFIYDTKNTNYFISGKSENLQAYKGLHKKIQLKIDGLKNRKYFSVIDKNNKVSYVQAVADILDKKIDVISNNILKRGFRDFGQVCIMRQHAHKLESMPQINVNEILMLRRHEKDYIIRNDIEYIGFFNERVQSYSVKLERMGLVKSKKNEILKELDLYRKSFNQLVKLDSIIGIRENTALKKELDILVFELLEETNSLTLVCEDYKSKLFSRFKILSIISVIATVLVTIIFSIFFSKHVTDRVTMLSDYISRYVSSNFAYPEKIPIGKRSDEVGLLVESFDIMRDKIEEHFTSLEEAVEERTEEIKAQNEQILLQNQVFTDSLNYAVNIQKALLPQADFVSKTLGEVFVFYRPKDLVSGDFYWYKHINNIGRDMSVFAVADCTGHGIPGAFMSLLGIAFLNEIVSKKDVCNSADVLENLRDKILDNLTRQSNEKVINDGMDIAFVVIDHIEMKLQYSGAYRDLFLVRNGKTKKISGEKIPIGKSFEEEKETFSFVEADIEETDTIYMFTDGFSDQQGGENGKKYLRKNLKRLLALNSDKPLSEQEKVLDKELTSWKRIYQQTDDILIAGFKARKHRKS